MQDKNNSRTIIYANFQDKNPNNENVEMLGSARKSLLKITKIVYIFYFLYQNSLRFFA